MIETTEQQNYIYFSKGMSTLTIDEVEVPIPQYVFRSTKRYRYNSLKCIIEKQCVGCREWYSICQLKDYSFNKINDESLIHFMKKSGAATYCRRCENLHLSTTPKQLPHIGRDDKKTYLNIVLPDHLKKYLKAKSYLEDRSVTSIIVELLETTSMENPITVSFK